MPNASPGRMYSWWDLAASEAGRRSKAGSKSVVIGEDEGWILFTLMLFLQDCVHSFFKYLLSFER